MSTAPTGRHPSRDDGVVRSVSAVVGGPAGDHVAGHPWWGPLRVVLAITAVVLALGMLTKAPCADDAGAGGTQRYAHLCWSDVSQAYVEQGYAEGGWPFTDDTAVRARYAEAWLPPVPAYVAWATSRVTHALAGSPDLAARSALPTAEVAALPEVRREARIFTALTAVLGAGLLLLAAGLLVGVDRRRPWAGAAFAAAPVLALLWPIGWTALAVVAVAGVLRAHARGRWLLAGGLLGLGAAASPLVALLLVPAAAVALRDRGPVAAARVVAAAVAAFVVAGVPAYASSPSAWRASWQAHLHGVDGGSLWLLGQQVGGTAPPEPLLWTVTGLGLLALAAGASALVLMRGRSLAVGGTVLLAGALFLSPAVAPADALLLLPLAALAVPRWRDLLVWQAGELFHWALLGFYLGGLLAPAGGGDARSYWGAIAARLGALGWLAVAALRGTGGLADVDAVEGRRGEPHPDVDVLADLGHPRP